MFENNLINIKTINKNNIINFNNTITITEIFLSFYCKQQKKWNALFTHMLQIKMTNHFQRNHVVSKFLIKKSTIL